MARNVAANSRSPLLARLPMYLMVHMNRFVEGEELGDLMSGVREPHLTSGHNIDFFFFAFFSNKSNSGRN